MSLAQTEGGPPTKHARVSYLEAKSRFEKSHSDLTVAWQLGQAAYELADLLDDAHERDEVAQSGIKACRQAISLNADTAQAQYYLALNLGEWARNKKLGAFKVIHEMEHVLLRAAQLDSSLDYGGPDRALGLLYLEAPSWPASIGNRTKARTRLERAVELGPSFPENRICLAEAYAKWMELKNLEYELNTIESMLPKARSEFSGDQWAATWADWEKRLTKLRKTSDKLAASQNPPASQRGARGR